MSLCLLLIGWLFFVVALVCTGSAYENGYIREWGPALFQMWGSALACWFSAWVGRKRK